MAGPCLLVDGPAPRPGASGAGAPGAVNLFSKQHTNLSGALLIGWMSIKQFSKNDTAAACLDWLCIPH